MQHYSSYENFTLLCLWQQFCFKIHCQWSCVYLPTDVLLKVSEVAQIFTEAPFHLLRNASADSKAQDPSILFSAVCRGGLCRAALSVAGTICLSWPVQLLAVGTSETCRAQMDTLWGKCNPLFIHMTPSASKHVSDHRRESILLLWFGPTVSERFLHLKNIGFQKSKEIFPC